MNIREKYYKEIEGCKYLDHQDVHRTTVYNSENIRCDLNVPLINQTMDTMEFYAVIKNTDVDPEWPKQS